MKRPGLARLAEIGAVAALLAGTIALVLAMASAVGGQSAPRSPAAPAAPAAPPAPGAPVAASTPDPRATQGLAIALLHINARSRSADEVVIGLGESLIAVSGRAHPRDPRRLAEVLVETLRGRELPPHTSERLADALATALLDPGADAALQRALGEVDAALRAAGLGAPAVLLVETELKRLTARGR